MTSPDRTFRLALAALFLLVQVLGTPVLRAMPCGEGGQMPCCCAVPNEPAPSPRSCCSGDEAPPDVPEPTAPCECLQTPAPVPAPVPDPLPRVADAVAVAPEPHAAPTVSTEAVAFRRPPEPRSRTGPPLHVRFCVFLD